MGAGSETGDLVALIDRALQVPILKSTRDDLHAYKGQIENGSIEVDDKKYVIALCNRLINSDGPDPNLSLEENFARDVELIDLTPEEIRSIMKARESSVRRKLLADHGLTQETLDSASDDLIHELGSKLMYETARSPEAKLELGLLDAAVAREKRLSVERKAEEILATYRKRAPNVSIPKKFLSDVQQRSTYLYWSELRDYFRSKDIEQIEKSDLLIPEFKAAALKAAERPNLPNLPEVVARMSAKLIHPDAFGQVLAERVATKQAHREHRRERRRKMIRKFFSFDSWLGALPLFVRKLIAPVEVKSVLSALDEEARLLRGGPALGPSLGIDIVTSRTVEDILDWRNEIQRDIRSGSKTPRATALWLMMNVTRDCLASGRFHIYRGLLSMQGTSLRSINTYCLDRLTELGLMTAEERSGALQATNEDIREMG